MLGGVQCPESWDVRLSGLGDRSGLLGRHLSSTVDQSGGGRSPVAHAGVGALDVLVLELLTTLPETDCRGPRRVHRDGHEECTEMITKSAQVSGGQPTIAPPPLSFC
jgi:hypothetical protein